MIAKVSLIAVLLVLLQVASASPLQRGWGLAKVKNSGGYTARFRLEYFVDGKYVKEQSGTFPVGQTKSMLIPPNTKDIALVAELNVFISSWSTVVTYIIDEPDQLCFTMAGTTLNPTFKKDVCQ